MRHFADYCINGFMTAKQVWLRFIRRTMRLGYKGTATNLPLVLKNTPKKSLVKSSYPKKYLPNSPTQKKSGIENFESKKIVQSSPSLETGNILPKEQRGLTKELKEHLRRIVDEVGTLQKMFVMKLWLKKIMVSGPFSLHRPQWQLETFLGELIFFHDNNKIKWRCEVLNPGLSACKADALPLSYTPTSQIGTKLKTAQ